MFRSTLKDRRRTRGALVPFPVIMALVLLVVWPGPSAAGPVAWMVSDTSMPLWLVQGSSPGEGLASGEFLVASTHLRDPNFSETAVLLVDYARHGAMGLIINRPSKLRLSSLWPGIGPLDERADTVYVGGPVARGQMLMLIRSDIRPEESHRVLEKVYVTGSRSVIEEMLHHPRREVDFRAFVGYAGWGPGQLDHEVSRGDWYVLKADGETIFDMEPSEIWPELIRRSSVLWAKLRVGGEKTSGISVTAQGNIRSDLWKRHRRESCRP